MIKRDIIDEYFKTESEIENTEHQKYVIESQLYEIMEKMS